MPKEDDYKKECFTLLPLLRKLSKEYRKNVMHEKRRKGVGKNDQN